MTENINNTIILAGGGSSGGHIFPLVAVAEELQSKKIPFVFIGSKHGKEKELVIEHGWQFQAISAGKWRRYLNLRSVYENFIDIFRVLAGFFQAISIILSTRASAVFSKGGYVALPVVLAAKVLGRRIIVHESDAVMGLTNRISARLADKVLVAFEENVYPKSDGRFIQVGIPIRKNLRSSSKLSSPKKSRPLIFVIAGLQGSTVINTLVKESLAALLPLADVVHVTGETEYLQYKAISSKLPSKLRLAYKPFSFVTRELAYYYQSADLMITRASATIIVEASLFGKALLLVPLPGAASNHQYVNAKLLEKAGAAVVRSQIDLDKAEFTREVIELISDKERLKELGGNLKKYFNEEDSIEKIIKELHGR